MNSSVQLLPTTIHQLIRSNSHNPKSLGLCVYPPQDLRAGLRRRSLFQTSLAPLLSESLQMGSGQGNTPKTRIRPKENCRLLLTAGKGNN